tara:strand:+ start:405 stop:1034 length:630 start_codon:yes stop_codon:yes gene_type:complete
MLVKKAVTAFMGQFFYIIIGLLANSVLSKLLGPNIIGKFGVVMVFVTVSCIVVEGGFGGALIQKKQTNSIDYSTVFIFNLIIGFFFTLFLFLISDLIGSFYSEPLLSRILKAICVIPLFISFQVSSNARLVREMRFKERAFYRIRIATDCLAFCLTQPKTGNHFYLKRLIITPITIFYFLEQYLQTQLIYWTMVILKPLLRRLSQFMII